MVMEISEVQGKLEKGEIAVAAQTPLYTFAAGWQGFLKHYTPHEACLSNRPHHVLKGVL